MVTAAAHKVDEVEGLGHDERQALRADVERVREVLRGPDVATNGTHGARGLRVRAGRAARGRAAAAPDRVARDRRRPPVRRAARRAPARASAGACCSSTAGRARIFLGTADGLEEVDRIEDDVHRQHDQGGWSQSRYQRSVEQEKLNHLGDTLDTLFTRFKRRPFDHLRRRRAARSSSARSRSGCTRTCARGSPGGSASTSRTRRPATVEAAAAEVDRPPRRGGRARGARPHGSRASAAATAASRGPGARDGGARAGARRDPAAGRGLRRAGARRRRSRRRSRSPPQVLVVRHHDDLVDARRDRRCASILSVAARARHRRLPERLHPRRRARRAPTATRSPGGSTRSRAPASTTSSSRRATGIRPTTARSPPRAARGRTTASRARPARELHPALDRALRRRRRRQGPGPRDRGLLRLRGDGPRRRCCASATSTT